KAQILPHATVVTPNHFEARTLAGMERIDTVADMAEAARRIHALGPQYVIVKGGVELPGHEAVDVLLDGEESTVYAPRKIVLERRTSAAPCRAVWCDGQLNPESAAAVHVRDLA